MIRKLTSSLPLSSGFVRPVLAGLATLAVLGTAPAIAEDSEEPAQELTKGEERLANLLKGRVAGEPQDCINEFRNVNMTTIDDTAYVYGRGRTIYVQRTRDPGNIDRDDILVIRKFNGSRLCRLDFVSTVDRYAGFFTGGVQFDQFVPYTRVDEDEL